MRLRKHLLVLGLSMSQVMTQGFNALATELPLNNNACVFTGTFEQKRFISSLSEALLSTGRFYHHCDHGVIWSTGDPIEETLVLRKKGENFLINSSGANILKSRQGKFLSKLLNGLMATNHELIDKQFKLKSLKPNHYQLTPSRRKLRRAIKSINLIFENSALVINIIDRNSQRTEIISKQKQSYAQESTSQQTLFNCESHINKLACSLLLGSDDAIKTKATLLLELDD